MSKSASDTTPYYAPEPESACSEAAARLNVVIKMLRGHDCPVGPRTPSDDDHQGYDMCVASDVLIDIRDLLLASARAHEHGGGR